MTQQNEKKEISSKEKKTTTKILFQRFAELDDEIKRQHTETGNFVLKPEQIAVIHDLRQWLDHYTKAQTNNAAKTRQPGRKKLPNNQIKPESLRRREKRAEAAKAKKNDHAKP